jgi:hypothetical protein
MATGRLTNIGQDDWVAVNLTANQSYEISIIGLSQFAKVQIGTASVLAGDGTGAFAVPGTDAGLGTATTQRKYFTPSTSGTYYVDVSDSDGTTPENYTVKVAAVTADVANNTIRPGAVKVGGSTSGQLGNVGQHDWVKVTLTANQAYELTVNGLTQFASIEIGTASGLANLSSSSAIPNTDAGLEPVTPQHLYFMPSASGTYYVDLSDNYAVTPEKYTLSVAAATADHTDNATHPGSVAVGGSTFGKLANIGQHDWIAVSLAANHAYEVTVNGLTQSAFVEIGTAGGLSGDETSAFAVAAAGTGGKATTQNLYFMPSASGTYYVDVSDSHGAAPETYRVSVAAVTADYTDNATRPGTVAVGGSTSGRLVNVGQHDWIAVSLAANQAYEFTVNGLTQFASVELATAAGLSGDGTLAAAVPGTDAGLGKATTRNLYFMPSASGTYYLDLSDNFSAKSASYTVAVAAVSADHTDNASHPGSVAVGGSTTGTLANAGQRDWVAVSLTANQGYEVTVNGLTQFDSVQIGTAGGLSGDGTSAFAAPATSTGGKATTQSLYFMPSASGTYYIDLADNSGAAPEKYTLSVAAVAADHTDNPTHPGTVAVTGAQGLLSLTTDFNGDGKSDILWQSNQGQAAVWLMNGSTPLSEPLVAQNPGPSWQVIGSGDFNGDGLADILWQSNQGQAAIWLMKGATPIAEPLAGQNPGPAWKVIGSGDFDGAGKSDILWQSTSGQAAIWFMNGATPLSEPLIAQNPGPSWHVIGSGDFTGNGKSDILWQNTDGQAAIWLMNGATPTAEPLVAQNPGPSWHVVGTGDFNGDGKSDILWQNTDGQAAIWLMNGATPITEALVGQNPGPSWHVVGAGDFSGNGKSDILWQSTSGQAAIWFMNGATVTSEPLVAQNPGTSWHIPFGS